MPNKYVIVVAGGTGSRMGAVLPKQFLEVNGRPILMRTLELFAGIEENVVIKLVLPEANIPLWDELCKKHQFKIDHTVVAGGPTRFQSVKNGLATLPKEGLVAIHDGVRPFVSPSVIEESFRVAEKHGNAVVSLPLKESIREVEIDRSVARDRSRFRLIQTPQTFDIRTIQKAYEQGESSLFTDDASVFESAGHHIQLITGNEENIKITHPTDLLLAEALLINKKSPI